jgi:hypothetical protein
MKHLLLALLLVTFASTVALADSPEAILKDYRKAAAQAVERLNQSLEKATTPLITKLIQQGDTAGADVLTTQIKEKQAGDAVPSPQASVVQLFALYDDARAKALAPVQKSSITRIDSLLKTAGGAKLETITELGKARAEIEAGKAPSANDLPVEWTYRSSPTGPPLSKVFFERDGSARMEAGPDSQSGTWEWKRKGVFIAKLSNDIWTITMKKGYAELESKRLNSMRYLVPFEQK